MRKDGQLYYFSYEDLRDVEPTLLNKNCWRKQKRQKRQI